MSIALYQKITEPGVWTRVLTMLTYEEQESTLFALYSSNRTPLSWIPKMQAKGKGKIPPMLAERRAMVAAIANDSLAFARKLTTPCISERWLGYVRSKDMLRYLVSRHPEITCLRSFLDTANRVQDLFSLHQATLQLVANHIDRGFSEERQSKVVQDLSLLIRFGKKEAVQLLRIALDQKLVSQDPKHVLLDAVLLSDNPAASELLTLLLESDLYGSYVWYDCVLALSPNQSPQSALMIAKLLQGRSLLDRYDLIKHFIIYKLREPYPPHTLEKFRALVSCKISEKDRRLILQHIQDGPYPQKAALIAILNNPAIRLSTEHHIGSDRNS
jgi:hypothetical protein